MLSQMSLALGFVLCTSTKVPVSPLADPYRRNIGSIDLEAMKPLASLLLSFGPMLAMSKRIQFGRRKDVRMEMAPLPVFDNSEPARVGFLGEKHAHPRDARIIFEEDDHRYFIRNEGENESIEAHTSVTEYVDNFKEPFDADKVITGMLRKSSEWPQKRPEYCVQAGDEMRPMTRDEIKDKWDFSRDDAANRGTYMHSLLEWLLTDPRTIPLYLNEMRNFFDFYEEYLQNATTYRCEWRVFDEELGMAGSIDYVGKLPDGTFIIADWKRSKAIIEEGFRDRMMEKPFDMLPDSNKGHYTLQVNIYKMILIRNYQDIIPDVSRMFIAGFHPDCRKFVEVEDLHLGVVDGKILPYQDHYSS